MADIRLAGLCKNFGAAPVLRGITLHIADGEFVVLVGPSGCGKSTLLRLIAGLETATSGDIHIGDERVNDLAPKARDIAMVFQNHALYPHMTVRENMTFSLRLRGLDRDNIARRVSTAAEKLGLQDMLEHKPRVLSGGQRQRVAMARAMVRDPKAFLFDEPLSNLDARLREQMRHEIRQLQRELGTTSVYVTHDQIEAMTMADRIVVMHQGIAQQIGTPSQLYDDPANFFVASFIGSPGMNFIDATLADERSDSDFVSIMVGRERLGRTRMPLGMPGDRRVVVGIRPERIEIGAPSLGLPARVDMVEPTGLGRILHVNFAHQTLRLFILGRVDAGAGDQIGIAVNPADLLLFDPGNGERIRVRQG
jgi:multiple sugar transport system ATP-binding protein